MEDDAPRRGVLIVAEQEESAWTARPSEDRVHRERKAHCSAVSSTSALVDGAETTPELVLRMVILAMGHLKMSDIEARLPAPQICIR